MPNFCSIRLVPSAAMPTATSRTAGLYAGPILPSCPWPQRLPPRVPLSCGYRPLGRLAGVL